MFVILFHWQVWGTHFTLQEPKSSFFFGGVLPVSRTDSPMRRSISAGRLWKTYGIFFTWSAWCAWALPWELFLARMFENPSGAQRAVHVTPRWLGSHSGICWFQESLFGFWYFRERHVALGRAAGREYRSWVISGCHFAEGVGGCLVFVLYERAVWKSCRYLGLGNSAVLEEFCLLSNLVFSRN